MAKSAANLAILHLISILMLGGFVYRDVHLQQFVWDTIPMMLENPWIHEWSWANFWSILSESHRANWHPAVLLSHQLDIWWFGYDPAPHKVMNVLYHLINSCLIYYLVILLAQLTQQPQIRAQWLGFITAIIFVVHPQHVESVAWVVERKDVLYTLFMLGCFITYLKTSSLPQRQGVRLRQSIVLPFVLFCLSVAAKPMAVTIPAILVLFDIYPLRTVNGPQQFFKACAAKLHYWLVTAIVIVVTLTNQSMAMPEADALPLWVRTLNAINNSAFYLQGYLWPVNLSPFYPYPDLKTIQATSFWLPGLLFLTCTIGTSLWLLAKNVRMPFATIGFYLMTLLPVSGLIHIGPAKAMDHFAYVATLPFSLLTAIFIVHAFTNWQKLKLATSFSALVYLIFLVALAIPQVDVWRNHLTLWGRVIVLYPSSAFGHRNMAAAYAEVNQWQLALYHAERSVALGSPDKKYVENLRSHVEQLNP